jgi:hypothetical protein
VDDRGFDDDAAEYANTAAALDNATTDDGDKLETPVDDRDENDVDYTAETGALADVTTGTAGALEDEATGAAGAVEDATTGAAGAVEDATTGAAGAVEDATTSAAGAVEDATIGDDDGLEDAVETVGVGGAWDEATAGDDEEVEDAAVDDGDWVDSDPNSETGIDEEEDGSMERPRDDRSRRMNRGEDDEAVDRKALREISLLHATSLWLSTHCLYAGNSVMALSNSIRV